ncbi:MAG: TIGR02996 domain-containing protein [Fimbriiglobus sp.]
MTDDELALVMGIATNPDADLPRLVYADWLEEHDRGIYAEFIRLQCEIARLEVGPRDIIDQNVPLWRRQQEILDDHLMELVPSFTEIRQQHFLTLNARFQRGFLDDVAMSFQSFVMNAIWLDRQLVPFRRFRVAATPGDFHQLLHLSDNRHERLTELAIENMGDSEVMLLPEPRLWPKLVGLVVTSSPYPNQDWIPFITQTMPHLRELVLPYNQMTDLDVMRWLETGFFAQLETINLAANVFGDQAALELADRFPKTNVLKSLDLRRNPMTSVGQNALLSRFGSKVTLF